jgi:hypothetical protein
MRKNEENQLRSKGQQTVQKTRKQLLGAQGTPSLGVSVKKRKFGPKLGQANSRRLSPPCREVRGEPPAKRIMRMKFYRAVRLLSLGLLMLLLIPAVLSTPSPAQVLISVRIGPPALPVYDQPLCPSPGYLWSPGYWAWGDDDGYYWVPGTWVEAPEPGLLWTPGYWGWNDGMYAWNSGYWGPQVGFYGGINYGYGYGGNGFYGGEWRGGSFFYNTAVMRVNTTTITNVYVNKTVIVNNVSHVAFNGGQGGVQVRPTAQQETYMHESHRAAVAAQVQQEHAASQNRALFASTNHGRPAVAATAKPGEFSGRGVVAARAAGGTYHAPAMSPKEARGSAPAENKAAASHAEAGHPEAAHPTAENHAAENHAAENHAATSHAPADHAAENRSAASHPAATHSAAANHAAPAKTAPTKTAPAKTESERAAAARSNEARPSETHSAEAHPAAKPAPRASEPRTESTARPSTAHPAEKPRTETAPKASEPKAAAPKPSEPKAAAPKPAASRPSPKPAAPKPAAQPKAAAKPSPAPKPAPKPSAPKEEHKGGL